MKLPETLTYDDVTLAPAYSELTSRSNANPEMHGHSLPIIGSCMDTLGVKMMEYLTSNNVPFIAHRAFKSAEEQYNYFLGNITINDNLDDILNSKLVNDMINGFKNNKKICELCKHCYFLKNK